MNPNSQTFNPLFWTQYPTAKSSIDEAEPCAEQSNSGGDKKPPKPPSTGEYGFSWENWGDFFQITIEELQLSVRAYNVLKRSEINSVGQLLELDSKKLLQIKGINVSCKQEIVEVLHNSYLAPVWVNP